ncbi:hypothetical protein C8F04DRAFT_1278409 [Mycena alexandri]|uniref:Uncharacterized protein n=1 Tax=Mycena alexandri TaxID=1745969 RepID=A0AAD6WL42_9AGAR|nr:hypothetical protein C8F04DRAFT_1278409 [Mycena alexandri]
MISARPPFLLGAPVQFHAFGGAASSSRLVRPTRTPPHAVPAFCVECRRARGTVLRARGRWNSYACPSIRVPFVLVLVHPRPRLSSSSSTVAPARHPTPCPLRISRPTRIKRGVCAPSPHTSSVPAVGIECRMCADAQPLVPFILVHPRLRLSPPHLPSCVPRPPRRPRIPLPT